MVRLLQTLLLVLITAFLLAPWFAFRALAQAARAQDYQALSRLIDTPAVEDGLRRQGLAQPDALLSPGALAALTRGSPPRGPEDGISRFDDLVPGLDGRVIRDWDPTRVRIAVKDTDGRECLFSFERYGLFGWRLEQLRPAGETGNG